MYLLIRFPTKMGLMLTLYSLETFVNSEDPNEMLQNAEFYKGLHCLLHEYGRQHRSSEKRIHYCLETLKNTTEHPHVHRIEIPFSLQRIDCKR